MLQRDGERFCKARQIVFRLLKFRLRSERELQKKLKEKKFPDPLIEEVIRYFKDLDLIDDRLFAQQWISSRLKKPFGIKRIRLELKDKGVDPDLIEAALKETMSGYDEIKVATELARHRALKYKETDSQKIKQRVYGYLLRRGFSVNTIIEAIKTL